MDSPKKVMFGQPMPEGVVGAAAGAVAAADVVLVVGTTLLVQPANALPAVALRQGTPLVIVNPFGASPYDECAAGAGAAAGGGLLCRRGAPPRARRSLRGPPPERLGKNMAHVPSSRGGSVALLATWGWCPST